jgi:glutathione S-transferase
LATALGVIWIVGRILYKTSYMIDPAKRGPGFGIQALACALLVLGSIVGAVMRVAGV